MVHLHNNTLSTSLYSKPTDSHSYLHPSSCHPPHTFKNIVYSQALRIRRICSDGEDSCHQLDTLEKHFQRRDYPTDTIKSQIQKAKEVDRSQLLKYKKKQSNNRVPIVTTYNPLLRGLGAIFQKHMCILHESPDLKLIFPEPPLTSFRRPRNLRDLLVHSSSAPKTISADSAGSHRCESKKCIACKFIKFDKKFQSTQTGETFPITSHLTCKETWLIYLITCNRCSKQYVGKTTTSLYTRFNNTRSEIKRNAKGSKSLPYVAHFNSGDHTVDDITLMPIEQIHNRTDTTILRRESFWIAKLKTRRPSGINAHE